MNNNQVLKPIAYMQSKFPTKFGIPRQSGLVEIASTIVFEPDFRNAEALRGLEDFSHLWLIWGFSETRQKTWSPTVRPPRLGGNKRIGVFATRSPFRPNSLGLSCVKFICTENTKNNGCVIHVSGADLMDSTPIYDIKPYLPYTDSHPKAAAGFTDKAQFVELSVHIPPEFKSDIPNDIYNSLVDVLAHNPRPSYQHNPERIYGLAFAGLEIKFTINENLLTVCEIEKI